jgi:putative phosphoesterase
MLIGVMSDTHGFLTEMRETALKMLKDYNVDIIIHLGDDSTDADELRGLVPDIVSVPGIFEERYKDPKFPNRVIQEFEGVPFLLTHTPARDHHDIAGDIDPTEAAVNGDVKVVLFGHTHMPSVEEKNGAIYINPGHMRPDDKRRMPPSFAVIELDPPKMRVRIIETGGEVIEDKIIKVEL